MGPRTLFKKKRLPQDRVNCTLTEAQRVPDGIAHAPGGRYDVEQRGVVAGRFPLHQHHQQARVERESDHWKTHRDSLLYTAVVVITVASNKGGQFPDTNNSSAA